MRMVLMFAGLSTVLFTLTRAVLSESGFNKACLKQRFTGCIPRRNLVNCSCKLCNLGSSGNIAPFIEPPSATGWHAPGTPGIYRVSFAVFDHARHKIALLVKKLHSCYFFILEVITLSIPENNTIMLNIGCS
jgi:hypothetical protein